MKVLVTFGDSDFRTVMHAFGELFLSGHREFSETHLTKPNVVRWFNTIALTLYEMVQARDQRPTTATGDNHLREYLTIQEKNVFIGDVEVDAKMETYSQWGNGDAVLVIFATRAEPFITIL